MNKVKTFAIGAVVAAVGVITALVVIKWGHENDIPVLKEAGDVLDR